MHDYDEVDEARLQFCDRHDTFVSFRFVGFCKGSGWAHDEAAELFSLTSQIGTETPNSSK
jgi:hypothetical protein